MTTFDFYKHSDAIRKVCDGMTPRQVKDLVALLSGDLGDRVPVRDENPIPTRDEAYRIVADALFQRGEAAYEGRVINRVGDEDPTYRVCSQVYMTVSEAMDAIDNANRSR